MTHYKVNMKLCDGLADGRHAFCGVPVDAPGETFHILGIDPSTPAYWFRPKVDCSKCIRMYDAVINDWMAQREP